MAHADSFDFNAPHTLPHNDNDDDGGMQYLPYKAPESSRAPKLLLPRPDQLNSRAVWSDNRKRIVRFTNSSTQAPPMSARSEV